MNHPFSSVDSTLDLSKAAQTKLIIFDVDGVLTDGGLYYGSEGESIKRFHSLDGLGIKLVQQFGISSAIITARQSPIVQRRAIDLGIEHVFQGVHDKRSAFKQLLAATGIPASACTYLGDDIIDLPILCQVGFAVAVANAHAAVKARVDYITIASGGNGAAREVCDLVLHAQGNSEAALAPYLS